MEKLFSDGLMNETKRLELMVQSEYFVRDMLRRFRVQQEDGTPTEDIEQVSAHVASLLAQFLWEHQ